MVTDSSGWPILFDIPGGQVNEVKVAPGLVEDLPQGEYVIADKGYDREELRKKLKKNQ